MFIDSHSVFDLSDPDMESRFAWAFRLANRIHVRTDEDVIRVGAEYFYNGLGYDDAHVYPWLMVDASWAGALGIPDPLQKR